MTFAAIGAALGIGTAAAATGAGTAVAAGAGTAGAGAAMMSPMATGVSAAGPGLLSTAGASEIGAMNAGQMGGSVAAGPMSAVSPTTGMSSPNAPQSLFQDVQKYTAKNKADGTAGMAATEDNPGIMENLKGMLDMGGSADISQYMKNDQPQALSAIPKGGNLNTIMARSKASSNRTQDKRTGKVNTSFYTNPAIRSLLENL